MTTMKTAMCNDFIGYFGDSSYLNQDGDTVIATLPDDLHALLLTLLRRNDLSNCTKTDGHTLDWNGFNTVLNWSGYLPPTNVMH